MSDKQTTKKEKKELLQKVENVLSGLHETGEKIDFKIISQRLGVARSTLYRNPLVRQKVIAAREDQQVPSNILTKLQQYHIDLEERIFNLEEKVKRLENRLK